MWLEDHLEIGTRTFAALQEDIVIAVPLIVKDDRPEYILNPVTVRGF